MWGGRGAAVRVPVAMSPAVELFGEGPSRVVVTARPRFAPALLAAGPPARAAGRAARDGRRRPAADRARRGRARPARRRSAGARIADTLDVPLDRAAPRLGPRPDPRPRLGGLDGVRRVRCGRAGRRADRGCRDRDARAVRAPASRAGVGRHRGQRRGAADALQGPRHDRLGARRAPPAEPARQPGDRALPLLDDGLDGLGERPADLPPGAAPGARDRSQRQSRQHPRAARPAAPAAAPACRPRPTPSS